MKSTISWAATVLSLLMVAGMLPIFGGSTALAADVYLRASSFDKEMWDGEFVPMWGFAECDASFTTCGTTTVPGPQINVATGEPLAIHVENTLPTPVSIVVPGQNDAGDPTWFYDGSDTPRRRVQSFTQETPAASAGEPGKATYVFDSPQAGTFLYQSGTYPSIQVPMGLYGAIVVGPGVGACADQTAAYETADSCYDTDLVVLYSEVDPWLNSTVASAGGDVEDYPVTVDYYPEYFLVNGEESVTLADVDPGDAVLVRMLNAGLESHYPELFGPLMGLVAQDSYTYPGAMQYQSSVLLAAGKTLDVLVDMPNDNVTFGLIDRGGKSNYSSSPGGGAAVDLQVGSGTEPDAAPTVYAVGDGYDIDEDTLFESASHLVYPSVLTNDVLGTPTDDPIVSVSYWPSHGTLVMEDDGQFSYDPDENFSGTDTFIYSVAFDGASYPAVVSLSVSFANDAPVAAADGVYRNAIGPDIVVAAPGVLGNDSDPDGDELTVDVTLTTAPTTGTAPATGTLTLNADGSFTYTGGTPGATVAFTYVATDGSGDSAPATVTLEVLPVAGIALHVADPSGTAVTHYRWTVQEDTTFKNDPPVSPAVRPAYTDSQSAHFHKSYMPVLAQGTTTGATGDDFADVALDPLKYYYVTILPTDGWKDDASGHTIGGAQILPGATAVDVLVNNHPIPTAQVSVLIFEDNSPTNGVWDPAEAGLGGYQVTLEDAGGRYGQNGGTLVQDAFGNPLKNSLDCFGGASPPSGVILSCPDGTVLVKNLAPGKYGVTASPSAGVDGQWIQTSTIEGTRVIDTWIKAGETPYMVEFGPGPHAFIGFVNPANTTVPEPGTNTITGQVTLLHDPRPPAALGSVETGDYAGLSFTQPWVGLNSIGGDGPSVATIQAETDGSFELVGIPDGDYQLVVWDTYLDQIISFQALTLAGGTTDVGHVPVNAWFTRLENNVFLDANQNGVRDAGEEGLPEQAVNIRFRDGSIFQSFPTDTEGFVPFDEVFPFFSWQVLEVDYTRFKATGVTVRVDGGGVADADGYEGILSLQTGSVDTGSPRTETGPVLTQAFQGFPGQTSVLDWGKAPYAKGENGGISGIVYYASTRGEFNPRLGVGDTWEPGIPGVKVRLYRQVATSAGGTALSLVEEVTTDSWDDALPEDCPGEDASTPYVTENLTAAHLSRCYDGWRNYNQVRPGVFDGGYAFNDIDPGDYVVEVVPPPGYTLVKEEDLNVGFGDIFDVAPVAAAVGIMAVPVVPSIASILDSMAEPGLAQPECVGAPHTVPEVLSLFEPGADDTVYPEDYAAPFAGMDRALCDRKSVHLADQGQSAADFFLFTQAPVAAQYTGLILDDVAIEPDPASPNFGEKWAPSYLPISLRDQNGHEVYRTYSDGYGRYNGVAASTYSANLPQPSGYSPAMYSVCLNDSGSDTEPDPYRNTNYGEVCYTLQFMPGTTTYLDTPVLPAAAFAAGYNSADCAQPTGTPELKAVTSGLKVSAGGTITLTSVGKINVPNPAWEGPNAPAPYNQSTIQRDFGFGATAGTVKLGTTTLTGVSWSDGTITATVPSTMASGSYQLSIARASGVKSVNTATVTVGGAAPRVVHAGGSIQAAIDAASAGELIIVEPGVYDEYVVMWKPVRLQGSGAGSTVIDAAKRPTEDMETWRALVQGLVGGGSVDLLPGQTAIPTMFGGGVLETELGAGILVLAKNDGTWDNTKARIDGFTILNADVGGGIVVNGYADNMVVSNNVVTQNSGWLGGGIRVGIPDLPVTGDGPFAFNTNVNIHHNAVVLNGAHSEMSAGGGVTLANGSDGYTVADNFICGNFTTGDGGGIGHLGLSTSGTISGNTILFNQSLNPTTNRSGGGVFVGGTAPEPPALSLGAGNVTIKGNRIQGNQAASGHGGGIRAEYYNGRDVELTAPSASTWYQLTITNNMIDNNVAAWSGGGISLQDVVKSSIIHNTIVHNDSTATVGALVNTATNTSEPQPAGISSAPHNATLAELVPGASDFSNPTLTHNIIWQNRSFSFDATTGTAHLEPELAPTTYGGCATGATYWDLGVLGGAYELAPEYSLITDVTGLSATNRAWDPMVVSSYCNGAREQSAAGPMIIAAAFEEGGNFVDLRYGPLTQGSWNYHLKSTSPAIDFHPTGAGGGWPTTTGITVDIDGQARGTRADMGADEYYP